jgi:hypothetical protein
VFVAVAGKDLRRPENVRPAVMAVRRRAMTMIIKILLLLAKRQHRRAMNICVQAL